MVHAFDAGDEVVGADSEDDDVGVEFFDALCIEGSAEMYGDIQAVEFVFIPLAEVGDALLEGVGAGFEEVAAEDVFSLVELDCMAAEFCCAGGFHAGHAAADDQDVLLFLCGMDAVVAVVHGCGIGAAHDVAGREVGLDAVGAGDAGTDALNLAAEDLVGVLGIHEGGAGQGDTVDLALGDGLFTHVGVVHLAGEEDGDVDGRLELAGELDVVALGHVVGAYAVIEGVIGTGVDIEHVDAPLLKLLRDLDGLFDGAADFIGTVQGADVVAAHVGLDAHAEGDGEVLAAGVLDGADDFLMNAQASLQVTAVLVGAVVGVGHGKLVEQVAPVHAVDLNAVVAAFFREGGELGHVGDLLSDLFLCQLLGEFGGILELGDGGT